jgi:hypothetical protein
MRLVRLVNPPQHSDQHRPERPILLAVDQEFAEGTVLLNPTGIGWLSSALVSRHDGWAWRGSASAVAVLMLLTACRARSDYCEQMDDVASSLEALVNTVLLGEGGVRAEFVDRSRAAPSLGPNAGHADRVEFMG